MVPFSFQYRSAYSYVIRGPDEDIDDTINRCNLSFMGGWTTVTRMSDIPQASLVITDTTVTINAVQWHVKSPIGTVFYWVEQGSQIQPRSYSMLITSSYSDPMLMVPHGMGTFKFIRMFACGILAITDSLCTCDGVETPTNFKLAWFRETVVSLPDPPYFKGFTEGKFYKKLSVTFWDHPLSGAHPAHPDTNVGPFTAPTWAVDGHVTFEALNVRDEGGQAWCKVIESTGNMPGIGFTIGKEFGDDDLMKLMYAQYPESDFYASFRGLDIEYYKVYLEDVVDATRTYTCGNAVNLSLWFKNLKPGVTYKATVYFDGCTWGDDPTCGSFGTTGTPVIIDPKEVVFTADHWAEVISNRGGDADILALVASLQAEADATRIEHPELPTPEVHVNNVALPIPTVDGCYTWFSRCTIEEA